MQCTLLWLLQAQCSYISTFECINMKSKTIIFIWFAIVILAIIPVFNIIGMGGAKKITSWNRSSLYSFDFSLPFINNFFYKFGISTNPNQVVIGKNDWLYLGDQYSKTVSVKRLGSTIESTHAAKKIGMATKSWDLWLKSKGVLAYKIMLGPDKDTIYPEFLPDWAKPAVNSVTNTLLANSSQNIYVDTRFALKSAKSLFSEPLYYKTDTHWNSLGAWVAFNVLAMDMARFDSKLKLLSEEQVNISEIKKRNGGDLSVFLRLNAQLVDTEVIIHIDNKKFPIETEQYDFDSGHLIFSGQNPNINSPKSPILVKSKNALNRKKVLWLRDSFGTSVSPFMSATFSEVLQLHYNKVNPEYFTKLVDIFHPDYVFITVVERDSLSVLFQRLPPAI